MTPNACRCGRLSLALIVTPCVLATLTSPCVASVGALQIASGLARPVYVTSPPADTDRLFILEQHVGRIRILNLKSGTLNSTPFLTVGGLATGNEQGLLGMAFDPNYAETGLFYIDLTRSFSDTEVRQYRVSTGDPNVADPSSNRMVVTFDQPFSNHNGGGSASVRMATSTSPRGMGAVPMTRATGRRISPISVWANCSASTPPGTTFPRTASATMASPPTTPSWAWTAMTRFGPMGCGTPGVVPSIV